MHPLYTVFDLWNELKWVYAWPVALVTLERVKAICL